MQSLGDSTLAAFTKSDLSKELENAVAKSSAGKTVGRSRSEKSKNSKDESDVGKYFKESLDFLSRVENRDKENDPPSTLELDAIPQSPESLCGVKSQEKSSLEKYSTKTSSKCNVRKVQNNAGVTVGKKFARSESWRRISKIASVKEACATSTSTLEVTRGFKDHEDRVNSRENNSGVTANRTEPNASFYRSTTNSSVEIPSRICTQDRCKLASWGLPLTILRKYEARGVTSMFEWQVECLSNRELLEKNRNLVYSAPTSAGKTLVAEILLIKTVLERRKKVIFILPFVSVVREKMYYFQDLLTDSGLRVEGFMGGCSPAGGFAATDVAIATIEKANSLLNQMMEEGNLGNLGAVVIDELHLLGDPYRGYLLELLLTKLKYMNLREDDVNVQLIGMSATLPNLALLAKWLDAELYKTDFRPVPLNELCKIGTTIYDNVMNNVRTLRDIPSLSTDTDNILQLCLETISDGHSVLIFCPTKNWCENLANQIATAFCKLGRENATLGRSLREQLSTEAIVETLEQLKRSPAGLDDVLRGTVSFGTAFHHAGLTMDERDVIEGAFRSGALRVLTATSTLSSGVNLPARRVIIRSLMFHGKPLDTMTYRQMIGRAGRMGKDTSGESILVCKTNETRAAMTLLTSTLPPIESCLEGSEPLIRALLEAVASEVAYTASDIDLYTKCTLVSVTSEDLIEESTREAIKFLIDNELFMLQTNETGVQRWIATPLGKACLAASMPPTDGLFLFEELQKARRCFVLDTELHVIYLVTPLNSSNQVGNIDWFVFLDLWKSISESERRVGQLVGVDENFVMASIRGSTRNGKILNVHKRFYTALALHDLVREVPLIKVCRKYGCCRGVIQSLQQSAATFAGMVTQFCKKLGWNCMELLIGQFQARLQFGVCRELLDLLRLPMLNGLRARSLYREGVTCVAELAVANVLDVERALHKALPFESGKEHNGEHELDAARRNKMRSVFVTGRDGLTPQEAATILVREARTLVQKELGLDDLQWKQREQPTGMSESSIATAEGDSTSIKQPAIRHSVGGTRVDTGRVSGEELMILEKTSAIEVESVPEIAEAEAQIRELVPNTINSNEGLLSNGGIDSDTRPTFFPDNTFRFTSTGSACNSKEDVIGSKARKVICKDVLASTSAKNTIDPKEDVTRSKVYEATCERDTLELTSIKITVDSREHVIVSKTREKFFKEDIFELTSTGNVVDPKSVGPKTAEEICMEDIFEFTSTGNAIGSDLVVTIGTKTHEDIFNKDTFELTSTDKVVDPKNVVGPKTGEEICLGDTFEFTSTGNAIGPDLVTVGTKTREENIFEFTNTNKTIDPKEDVAGSKINETDRTRDILEFTSTGNTFDPMTVIGSKTSEEIRMEGIFEFTSSGNAIDQEILTIGTKTREEICREDVFEFRKNRKKVAVGSPNREEISDDVFEFAITESPNDPKDIVESKTSGVICGEIFKFTGTERPTDREEKLTDPKSKALAMSPIILLRETLTTGADSRSPSLFGDSLNLDTQECNILEQNVIGSLNVSAFGDTIISGFAESQRNTPEERRSDVIRSNCRGSAGSQRRFSLKNTTSRRSPRISESKKRSKSLIWDDDSWSNTNGVTETINMLNTAITSKVADTNDSREFKTPPNSNISEKSEKVPPSKRLKGDHEDRLFRKNRTTELQKLPQKRKLSELNVELSPIASLLKISEARKLSIDSNKSDSDDVVIPSRNVVPSTSVIKNRTRRKLESLRKSRTQKGKKSQEREGNERGKDLLSESCSIESVGSSSGEETPVKRGNVPTKTKTVLPIERASVSRKTLSDPVRTTVDETRIKKPAPIWPGEIKVVNVAANWAKFNQFKRDLINKNDIALALACETFLKGTVSIGTKIIGITGIDGRKKTKKIDNCVYGNKKISGVAVSWNGIAVHYISFDNTHESKVPVKERLDFITEILNSPDLTVRCFSFKETYKMLYNCCRITSTCKFLDPKTADWLLDPEHSDRSFNALVAEYLTEAQLMLQRTGAHLGGAGPGLNVKSAISSEIRATTEAALTWHLMDTLMTKLKARSSTLLKTFTEIEMRTLTLLARMELTGLGVNLKSLEELSEVIQQEMAQLENKAYSLAGRKFNFSSSKSVAQVLGLYKGKKVSTNKAALEHCENPISRLVVSWRKLSTTQIKVVFPLLGLAECNSRIHGNCFTNTVTGRISMFEPNLQSVPRDFSSQDNSFVISVRMAFVPMHGNVILSADYCQLELRILAHLSKEPNLCRILQKKGDVFKSIAARWYNVAEEKVDDSMRQRTKQLCYGMIYGMGAKTLAETLSVTESEAKEFLEKFMGSYPGIRRWLTQVVEKARTDGYVTTLLARRRFLPALNSEVSSERSQAERQAVNTKVQGSAADIAKKAMVKIDERMRREFPDAPLVLTDIPMKRKLRSCSREELARGGYLVLQIHDELLYEVNATDLQQVGRIIKEAMEKSCELRVPLPVKLKVGPTWGDLTETEF